MEDLLELDDNDLTVEDATSEQGERGSTSAPSKSARQPKVNLDEFDEFRKYKGERQRTEYQLNQALDAERRARQQYEERLRRIELDGLDDVGKLAYERDELRRQLYEIQENQQRQYAQWQWEQLKDEVSRETGVPADELEEAKDSNDLWRIGRRYERAQLGKKRTRDDDDDDDEPVVRNPDDRVDIGGGKATTQAGKLQQLYNKALAQYDLDGMWEAEERAIKAGIRLKHQQ